MFSKWNETLEELIKWNLQIFTSFQHLKPSNSIDEMKLERYLYN